MQKEVIMYDFAVLCWNMLGCTKKLHNIVCVQAEIPTWNLCNTNHSHITWFNILCDMSI